MTPDAPIALEANGLCARYPAEPGKDSGPVLAGLSLCVREGEVVAIVGPNGAGKTTLLHALAGLHPAESGTVALRPADGRTAVALVFQDYAESLLPWRTNLDNLALPLEVAGVDRATRLARVHRCLVEWSGTGDLLAEVGIPPDGFPYALSGGQRQWLAVLRAYVANPAVVLLDEPFAALDFHGRLLAQARLCVLHHREPRATVIVSHELDEAVFLADRVLVLSRRPARTLREVEIDLPRPRPPIEAVLGDPRYAAACGRVQAAFIEALCS